MIEWLQGWSMVTWAFAIGAGLGTLVVLAKVFGAETLRTWVAAVWNRKAGP